MKLSRGESKKARIEIIPMIDAIFFLLVFFMMTSLEMVQLDAKRVNLPQSGAPSRRPQGAKVVVSLSSEGDYYVGRRKIAPSRLVGELSPLINAHPGTIVILNVDRQQKMGGFARLFDLVKQANPSHVMLAASPREPGSLPDGTGGPAADQNRSGAAVNQ